MSKKPPQKQTSLMPAPLKQAPHLGCRERKIKSMFMLLLNCPTGEGGIMLEGEQLVWLDQWWWSYNIKIWQYTKAQFLNILPVKICHVSVLWTKLVNCLWEPRWRDIRSFSNSTFLHLFFLSILIYDYICKYRYLLCVLYNDIHILLVSYALAFLRITLCPLERS